MTGTITKDKPQSLDARRDFALLTDHLLAALNTFVKFHRKEQALPNTFLVSAIVYPENNQY